MFLGISPFFGRFASCFTAGIEHVIREELHDANLPEKGEKPKKHAILTNQSKIFIKAKLTVSKSCLLGLLDLMIFCVLRYAHI